MTIKAPHTRASQLLRLITGSPRPVTAPPPVLPAELPRVPMQLMILLFGRAAGSSSLPLMQPHLLPPPAPPPPPLLLLTAGEKTGLLVIYYWQSHQELGSGFYTPLQTGEGWGEEEEEAFYYRKLQKPLPFANK